MSLLNDDMGQNPNTNDGQDYSPEQGATWGQKGTDIHPTGDMPYESKDMQDFGQFSNMGERVEHHQVEVAGETDDAQPDGNIDAGNTVQTFGNWYGSQGDEDVRIAEPVAHVGSDRFGYQSHQDTVRREMPRLATDATASRPSQSVPSPRDDGDNGRFSYATPTNPYDRQERGGKEKKGGHLPWLVGGIAAGAIVVGLGFAGIQAVQTGNLSVPDHTTTQWDGTEEDKPKGVIASNDDTATPKKTIDSDEPTLAREVADKCLPSVVAIHVSDGMSEGAGSGVIVDSEGHVLTNSHVVKDMQTIIVVSGDGEEYSAKLLGLDDSSDLAVLDVDWGDTEVTPMEYGDSSELLPGDWVMTIGSPYGLDQSVSTGIVSALSRNQMMESYGGYRIYANLIQTDAAINMGNSGGALVNSDGELVGINSMLASNSGSYSAVGFAIPSNYAKRVADQIIEGKEVEHAYIGAQFGNVSKLTMQKKNPYGTIVDESGQEVDDTDGTPTTGAYVAGVMDDSPAKEAGLQEGDIITKFGSERISSASGIIMAIRAHEIGDTVTMTVWRDGKEITLDVTLGSDAGKGLYDNEGSSTQRVNQQQNQQYPYGDDYGWDYFERMLEELGIE